MQNDDYGQAGPVEYYGNNALQYSGLAEWYITACMGYLLVEAYFYNFMDHTLKARAYWFLSLTPWNTWPSAMWFFSFGLLFGIFICLSKKDGLVPIRGKALFILLWLVILFGAVHGKIAGYKPWLGTFRQTILPSAIVFWVVVLAQSIRYEVILSRFIVISLPLAVLNVFYAVNFFAGGAIISKDSLFGASWYGTFILILAYLAAFARTIAGQKNARIALIILFCGIMAPLHKPVMATFAFANFLLLFLAFRVRKSGGDIRIGKTFIVIIILLIVGMIGGSIIFGLGNNAASQYLVDRILKGGGGGKDLSGGRLGMWVHCLKMWTKNPILGRGLGIRLYGVGEDGIPFALPIHNLLIQILMETGLIGFLTLILAVGGWLRRSFKTLTWETRSDRLWPRLVIITWVATMLFSTLFGEPLTVMPIAFIFWMMLAFECASHSQMIQWYQMPENPLDEVS
ncbi:MAG TPA: hypothetical protein ENH49_01580 [Candidatus Marinimicrobia bacterium]|nr:hypothetical protein [Candidatus Neomarinimicrobiota bacterium]